jgi:hypothetical protein
MSGPQQLTRSLLAPPTNSVTDRVRGEVRDRMLAGVVPRAEQLAPSAPLEINLAVLRQVRSHPETVTRPDPAFAWKPVFVRRSLGLAVVQACIDGRFRTPADAAEPVAAEAVEEWRRTGWRTYHWEPWLAGLAPGGRVAVVAEAVTWATALWSTFDWRGFDAAPRLGGVDDQWLLPADRTVRLKGRSELRVPVRLGASGSGSGSGSGSVGSDSAGSDPVGSGSGSGAVGSESMRPDSDGSDGPPLPEAMVAVTGGAPDDRWAEELAFLALVAGLASPLRPVPVRVMGVWPDAGATRMVAIDDDSLKAAADLVVDTVGTLVDARRVADAAAA